MSDDRTIRVRLLAVVDQYLQGMKRGASATAEFGRKAAKAGDEIIDNVGKAEELNKALGAMGTAFVATTAAAAGMGISLAKVGVSYNALEATSRTAMATLLGSTRAANAAMDELFGFTSESPFGRETFIRAQQTLIGFGMEAEKVVPTLAAIQDAMAAVGKGDAEITRVVEVLAQVTSTGRFTALELRRLGFAGVDAARLIGEQMGMTAEETRAAFTAGTVDARAAVDALVAQMAVEYAGAAENMKQLWEGAWQAVGARWRNIGSDLAEPFVSKQGGGAAVDWVNQLGEMLSSIRTSVVPALVPHLDRVATSASTVVDRIEAFVTALDARGVRSFMSEIQPMVPALAGIAGALTAAGASSIRFLPSINPVVGALAGIAAVSPEVRAALLDLGAALGELVVAMGPFLAQVGELVAVVGGMVAPVIEHLADAIRILAAVIDHMPIVTTAAAAAFVSLALVIAGLVLAAKAANFVGTIAALSQLRNGAAAAAEALAGRTGAAAGLARALLAVPPPALAVAAAVGAVIVVANELGREARESAQRVRDMASAMSEAGSATEGLRQHFTRVIDESSAMRSVLGAAGISAERLADTAREGGPAWESMRDSIMRTADILGLSTMEIEWLTAALARLPGEIGQAEVTWRELAAASWANIEPAEAIKRVLGPIPGILGDLGDAASGVKAGLDAQARSLDEATRAMSDYLSEINAGLDAQADFYAGLQRLTDSLHENGRSFDITTEAGRKNHQELRRVSEAVVGLMQQRHKETGSTEEAIAVGEAYVDNLVAQMRHMGMTQEQVDGLLSTYGLIPQQIATQVLAEDEASAVLDFVKRAIGALPFGHTIVITAEDRATAVINRLIASLPFGLGNAIGPMAPTLSASPGGSSFSPMAPSPRAGGGSGGGGRESWQAPGGWELQQAMREAGFLGDQEWEQILRQRIASTRQFSDDWMEAWRELERFNEERGRTWTDVARHFQQIEDNQYAVGRVSTERYRSILIARLAATQEFSDEWLRLHQQIAQIAQDGWDQAMGAVTARFDRLMQARQLEQARQAVTDAQQAVRDARATVTEARAAVREAEQEVRAAKGELAAARQEAVQLRALEAHQAELAARTDAYGFHHDALEATRRAIEQNAERQRRAADDITRSEDRLRQSNQNLERTQDRVADAQRRVGDAQQRVRDTALRLVEVQRDLLSQGQAGEDQWRALARQAGLTTTEIDRLAAAYRNLQAAQQVVSLEDRIRAEFARQGRSLTAGDTRGETGAQRVQRIAAELRSGRTWDDLVQSISRLPRRAMGGAVWPGQSFLVGEQGPEVFEPRMAGQVRTMAQAGAMFHRGQLTSAGMSQGASAPVVVRAPDVQVRIDGRIERMIDVAIEKIDRRRQQNNNRRSLLEVP